ncbi:MAG: type II toxin-antitoxin system RelE/ParE family toxin [Acidobacteriota bacterium]|nr:type II toxin-antitoxin system RelE/ParE family toxin [Acidobacteriota bacterium]
MTLRVSWTSPAERDLRRLEQELQRRIVDAVDRFADTGHGDVVRLKDVSPPEYRLRVGDWRVRFAKGTDTLSVLRMLPRDKAYR